MTRENVVEHGNSQKTFVKTLFVLISIALKRKLEFVTVPTWKTLYDRFKIVLADHWTATQFSRTASRVTEDETE